MNFNTAMVSNLFRGSPARLFFLWLLLCSVWSASLLAADPVPDQDTIAAERSKIESSSGLSDAQRKLQLGYLDQATGLLNQAKLVSDQITQLDQTIQQVPTRLKALKRDLARIESLAPESIQRIQTDSLKSLLEKQGAMLDAAVKTRNTQDNRLTEYLGAAQTGGAELARLRTELENLQTQPGGTATPDSIAQRILTRARRHLLTLRQQLLKLRQNHLDTLTQLAQSERDTAYAQSSVLQDNVERIRNEINDRQVAELEKAALDNSTANTADLPASIQARQQAIAQTFKELSRIVIQTGNTENTLDNTKRQLEFIQKDYKWALQAIQVAGDSDTVSAMLRKRRALLPSIARLGEQSAEYRKQLNTAVARQFELEEQSRANRTVFSTSTQRNPDAASKENKPDTNNDPRIEALQTELDNRRDNILKNLVRSYNAFILGLSNLQETTVQLVAETRTYQSFINNQLLWSPSNTGFSAIAHPSILVDGIRWLANWNHLASLGHNTRRTVKRHPIATILWLLVLTGLFSLRRKALAGLSDAAIATRRVSTDSMTATFSAAAWTLVLILPLPLLFLLPGFYLGSLETAGSYTLRISAGLQSIGHTLLFYIFLRELCRPDGLAIRHLRWNADFCDRLRKTVETILPLAVLGAFLFILNAAAVPSGFIRLNGVIQEELPGLVELGRLGLLCLMFANLLLVYRVWGRKQAWLQPLASHPNPPKWIQYHGLWWFVIMALPVVFMIASILGFDYATAYFLSAQGETVWLVTGLIIIRDTLLRSLFVAQRKLRLEEAIKSREAYRARALSDNSGTASASAEVEPSPVDEEKIDYGELSGQVRQLVQISYTFSLIFALWWLWRDIIPALSFLNEVQLPITTSKLVDGVDQTIHLTLSDLLSGLLFAALTFLAARNLPGILEFTLLQRIPLSRATRYATTTLAQYLTIMVGVVIAFQAVGLQWSSIQWLVAALSVGLGFGLQEIVANFVSGIILLFEQPIRVGDVVTIDGTSGTVARIRIRATTIITWERQELVIPNKNFITNPFVNWSLSDTVTRVVINVGVAYGSDTRKAMALIAEAAAEHPKVLDDPAPRINFEAFGDNTLNLSLRAYLEDLDARLPTITDLHQAINDKFEANGIVIAFPQRDIHLDTSRPLELMLRRDAHSSNSSDQEGLQNAAGAVS